MNILDELLRMLRFSLLSLKSPCVKSVQGFDLQVIASTNFHDCIQKKDEEESIQVVHNKLKDYQC